MIAKFRAQPLARARSASPARTPAPPARGRPTRSRRGSRREQHPGHRQVGGRVARGDITEVDHAADLAIVHQDVRRVQIAVQPHRRAVVAGSRERRVPPTQHRVPLGVILAGLAGDHGKIRRKGSGALGTGRRGTDWPARPPGRDVQRAEEPAHAAAAGSHRRSWPGPRARPAGRAPRSRNTGSAAGYPGPFRIRDGQGQLRCEAGQPALLAGDDLRAEGTTRQPRDVPVSDPVQLVVPAVRENSTGSQRGQGADRRAAAATRSADTSTSAAGIRFTVTRLILPRERPTPCPGSGCRRACW